ncbi:DUF6404 family protein [Xenorhabdus bovienii]|uniref:DUF6404 family protein n=1 Tax=Xenorhabdus bovienii TaxID=40576 RepID=UPI001EDCDB3A|nr:DUF6404 family protein [Xenorhabdus bovienii]MCG3460381.1 DUF6404 family protein [Xenorhabdus bovienii]
MTFENKKYKAIQLMATKGLWRSNSIPCFNILVWKLGVKIPPPTFASFWSNVVIFGSSNSILWSFLVYLDISYFRRSTIELFLQGIFFGFVSGILFASFHFYRRKTNKLPDWKDL